MSTLYNFFFNIFLIKVMLSAHSNNRQEKFKSFLILTTSLPDPTNRCFPFLHPFIFKNSSNSSTFLEQQLQPNL